MNVYDSAETGVSFLLKTIMAYTGGAMIYAIFLLMFVIIAIFGKKKGRTAFFWPAFILALTIFNPYVFPFIFRADASLESDYYQCLWLVPLSMIAAYGAALLIFKFKSAMARFVVAAVFAAAVIVTGTPSLASAMNISIPDNAYLMDTEVVGICDYIDGKSGKDTPAVAFENVDDQRAAREYDASILPSDILQDKDAVADAETFKKAAAQDDADYFVVEKDGPLASMLQKAGLRPLAGTGGSVIYRNTLKNGN